MHRRRFVFSLAVLAIVAGALLACFSPGGILNQAPPMSFSTPFGSIPLGPMERTSPLPVVGYSLLALGGSGGAVAFSLKPAA